MGAELLIVIAIMLIASIPVVLVIGLVLFLTRSNRRTAADRRPPTPDEPGGSAAP